MLERTWELIKRGLDRINSLVQEMLEFTRQRAVQKRMANVNAIIRETVEFVARDLAEKKIELNVQLDDSIPDCLLDDKGFYKAFLNLLVNASEAVDSGAGRINVQTLQEPDGAIQVCVEDNGSGISAENLARIFQPFFTTKGSKGSGLGLPMTRKIIEAMGGQIRCRSEVNVGTVFEITIRPALPVEGNVTLAED